MQRRRMRHSNQRSGGNYAKPWDEAWRSERQKKLMPSRRTRHCTGKVKENYAKEVVEAMRSEKSRKILPSKQTRHRTEKQSLCVFYFRWHKIQLFFSHRKIPDLNGVSCEFFRGGALSPNTLHSLLSYLAKPHCFCS